MPHFVLRSLSYTQLVAGFFFLLSALSPRAHWICKSSSILNRCIKPVDIWGLEAYLDSSVAISIQTFAVAAVVAAFLALVLSANSTKAFRYAVAGLASGAFVFSLVPWILVLSYTDDKHVTGSAVYSNILASFALLIAGAVDLYSVLKTKQHRLHAVAGGAEEGLLEGKPVDQLGHDNKKKQEAKLVRAFKDVAVVGAIASVFAVTQLFLTNHHHEHRANDDAAKGVQIAVALLSVSSAVVLQLVHVTKAHPHLALDIDVAVAEYVVFAFALLSSVLGIAAVVLVNKAQGEFELASISSLVSLLSALAVTAGTGYLGFS